jgi:8-oxo-dGTP pyrophosphatase MutT (NUDIX family)
MSAPPTAASASAVPVERRAARVLLLDGGGRVLLFRGCDPSDASQGEWWFTPGGGLDPGESAREGAARELAEETGLRVDPADLGPVVFERVARFRFAGGHYRQTEDFFCLRVDAHEVDTAGFTELEVSAVLDHRWWEPADLRATAERVYPVELVEVLERLA